MRVYEAIDTIINKAIEAKDWLEKGEVLHACQALRDCDEAVTAARTETYEVANEAIERIFRVEA